MNQSLDLCIRQAYFFLGKRRKGKFSEASQGALLTILSNIYGVTICRRTLNYHMRKLQDSGELTRIRRHKKGAYGRIQFHTTLVILKKKATDVLKRLARWFRQCGFNNWYFPSIDMDAPKDEQHASMILSFLKTTSG